MPYKAATDDAPLIEQDETARDALILRYPQYRETIESMHCDGVAVMDPKYYLYDLDEARLFCENARSDTDALQDAWMSNRGVQNIAAHASVIKLLSSLYGRRAFPFRTTNYDFGTEKEAHADSYHFNAKPNGFMCAVWVALEDADYHRHISALVAERGFSKQQSLLKKRGRRSSGLRT